MHVDDGLRRGLSPDEARRQALVAVGGMHIRDSYRDRGGVPTLEFLLQDVRFASRMLRKAPGFTCAAALILAVGIGANAALFSLVNGLLFKPLNGGLTGELMGLYSGERSRPDRFRSFSYPEYVDIREQNPVFAGLLAESVTRVGLTEGGLTRRATATLVSSNYFSTLGVTMAAGRSFTVDEERPQSGATVAVVSYAYWRQRALNADVIGQPITVNGRELTIVGVAPDGFSGTMPVLSSDVWLPFGAASLVETPGAVGPSARVSSDRSVNGLLVAGTLKAGLTAQSAERQLSSLARALERAYPQFNRDQQLVVFPRSRLNLGPRPRSDAAAAFGATLLMAVAGLVLVVACFNLANIFLARGSARQQEIAVRLALGGTRFRIVRQLLIEGFLLSMMGGVAALLMAWWASSVVLSSLPTDLPLLISLNASPDARVIAAVLVACLASTVVFALFPAWTLSRPDLAIAVKQSSGAGHLRRRRVPTLLVGGQIALSLALLLAAGMFVRAGVTAATSDPGFPLEGGLMAGVDVGIAGLDETRGRAAYAAVLDSLRALPNVQTASVASMVPFGPTRIDRQVRRGAATTTATFTVIGAGYFSALGLPVLAGREFMESEERQPNAEPVAIVDRLLAARLFPDENPVGQSVTLFISDAPVGELVRIVGLVPPVRDDIVEPPAAHIYVASGRHYRSEMTVHVRTDPGQEAGMLEPVRHAIHRVDARLPIVSLLTMTHHRDTALTLWIVLLAAKLFAAFGMIALVLATVGVYGLRAYLVARRTREMGIRMALGATRREVISQLLRESVGVTAAGLLTGSVLAVGLLQILRGSGMLTQVSPTDPLVFSIAPVVLAATIAAASYLPARRAVAVDPARTLRSE
jgi:predicted permease